MKLEDLVFKNSQPDFKELAAYGFKKENHAYLYEKYLPDKEFEALVKITDKGKVIGKVIDQEAQTEYIAVHTIQAGKFVNRIRREYVAILKDVKKNCFISHQFHTPQANRIAKRIDNELGQKPEFMFVRFPDFATFRIPECAPKLEKIYAAIAYLDKGQYFSRNFKQKSGQMTEILSFKFDPLNDKKILSTKGIFPNYFIKKKDWAALFLNDSFSDDQIMSLLKKSQQLSAPDKYWLIPANPKYFDVVLAFKEHIIIDWKQSSKIKKGDIVFMYVGSTASAILYQCSVLKTDIPYPYHGKNVKMKYAMKIKRLKVYQKDEFNFEELKKYDVRAIRGPRHVPLVLLKKLLDDK